MPRGGKQVVPITIEKSWRVVEGSKLQLSKGILYYSATLLLLLCTTNTVERVMVWVVMSCGGKPVVL